MGVRAPGPNCSIRPAQPAEQRAIEALLAVARLPVEGVATFLADFFVAEESGHVIGSIGLERYGAYGMLRSLVVHPSRRRQGLGTALTQRLLADADARGLTAIYLLATTAITFFPRFDFIDIERDQVPPEVQRSRDFLDTSPASAVVMRRVPAR
jgi:N-acetylglutamate synthase-like GNAT family acetyltransferase